MSDGGERAERARSPRAALVAAVSAWALARVVVGAALGLSAFVCAELGPALPGGSPAACSDRLLAWDAAYYEDIAAVGYGGLPADALRFFPLFPLLARLVALPLGGGGQVGVGVLAVANLSALALGLAVFALVRRETGDGGHALRATWLLALAPPAYVLVMGYSEALATLLAVLTFLGLRSRRWGWAAAAGFLAGLTRPLGALLAVPALIEALRGGWGVGVAERAQRLAAVVAPVAGVAAYLLWVQVDRGDGLLPLQVQQEAGRRGGFANPVVTTVEAVRGLGAGRIGTGLHVPWVVLMLVLLVVLVRRWPASYAAFAGVTLAVAVSARNLDSLERYCLSAFPFVFAAATLTGRGDLLDRAVLVVSAIGLLGYATLAFLGLSVP